jgi:hypothetical protein
MEDYGRGWSTATETSEPPVDDITSLCWSAPKVPHRCVGYTECPDSYCPMPLPDNVSDINDPLYRPTEISWVLDGFPYKMEEKDIYCEKHDSYDDYYMEAEMECRIHSHPSFRDVCDTPARCEVDIYTYEKLCWSAPKVPLYCKNTVHCAGSSCYMPHELRSPDFIDPDYQPTEISWYNTSAWDAPQFRLGG